MSHSLDSRVGGAGRASLAAKCKEKGGRAESGDEVLRGTGHLKVRAKTPNEERNIGVGVWQNEGDALNTRSTDRGADVHRDTATEREL